MIQWLPHVHRLIDAVLPGMKLTSLVFWTLILLWAQPAYARTLWGNPKTEDWYHMAIGAAGFSLVGYQVRLIMRFGSEPFDYWTFVLLLVTLLAAAVAMIFLHYQRAPDRFKRSILRAHAMIIVLCFIGGFI